MRGWDCASARRAVPPLPDGPCPSPCAVSIDADCTYHHHMSTCVSPYHLDPEATRAGGHRAPRRRRCPDPEPTGGAQRHLTGDARPVGRWLGEIEDDPA